MSIFGMLRLIRFDIDPD